MTAIIKKDRHSAPPATKAGLVFPGLGHLMVGEWVHGSGIVLLTLVWLWAAVTGWPRLSEVLFILDGDRLSWHSALAFFSWFAIAGTLWFTAYRRANPRILTDEEWNSNRQIFIRQMLRHRAGMLGWYGVLLLMMFTVLAPMLAPYHPDLTDMGDKNIGPSLAFLMGTDEYGRDVFSRLLYGARISMSIGFVAVGIAATLGTSLGAIAAFAGSFIDRMLMWFTDLLMSLPRLVLLLAIVGMIKVKGVWSIFLIVTVLGLTGWMGVARIVRSQVLSLKQQEFIQAARALGYSSARIVFKHLIPNAMAPVIVYCSLAIGGTMLAEAGLSFLGLGVQPPTATWGVMVADGRHKIVDAPWIAMAPGFTVVFAVMSFNLLGDGLRDALDPKLR